MVPPDHQFFDKLFHCKPSILGYPPFIHILVPPGSVFPYVGVSVDGLLVQIHVEVPALAGLKVWMLFLQFYVLFVLFLCIQTAIGAGSCFGFGWALWHEQHLLLFLLLFLLFFPLFFLLRAADAISCGGACSASSGCCFCNSMCCLFWFRAFKLQLVPVLALGFVRALRHEQHLLFLLLVFLLIDCWCRFMWRCLLWQVWMLFLQFYVLLALFLCIEIAVGAGSCFGFWCGFWCMSSICCSVWCSFCCFFC